MIELQFGSLLLAQTPGAASVLLVEVECPEYQRDSLRAQRRLTTDLKFRSKQDLKK